MTQQQNNDLAIQVTNVRADLGRMSSEFKAALPAAIPVERFIRTAVTAVQMDPNLLTADRRSLYGACMKAAQDGLQLDGREAALVIFKDRRSGNSKVQYMPMVGGILKKIRNSGEISTITSHVVYSGDEFEYELGDDERIYHKPAMEDRGQPIAVYAIAKAKDGGTYREVMSVAEVRKVQNVSRSRDSGPWTTWWDEMARKTVVRRLAKYLPSCADIDQTFESDNANYDVRVTEPGSNDVVASLNQQIQRQIAPVEVLDAQPVAQVEPTTTPEPVQAEQLETVQDPLAVFSEQ
jgi:recombination protein RecT